jgi:23S rRNA pseudouridine955/2504/2580 synthase
MSGVTLVTVAAEDADLRLDRWFKRHYPGLTHIRLEKLLRTGQVRVEGGRVKAAHRLEAGQVVRVPPLDPESTTAPTQSNRPRPMSEAQRDDLQARILYRDKDVIAFNKPAGLAVQGGTGTPTHLDGMLDALTFEAKERPRLVHRLDKDTSGVLLLARNANAATWLTAAFREKTARKIYWAVVAGVPRPHRGRIRMAIGKGGPAGRERVSPEAEEVREAVTYYTVVEQAAQKAAWLALLPVTGRTHQLRVHCAEIGTPILGDGKYGAGKALIPGLAKARDLHLHARSISFRRPDGRTLEIVAPLPPHMEETWGFMGFEADTRGDPFRDLEIEL